MPSIDELRKIAEIEFADIVKDLILHLNLKLPLVVSLNFGWKQENLKKVILPMLTNFD